MAAYARDVVVAGLPDHRVVVAQHSERIRGLAPHRVVVVDVVRDAVVGQRLPVVVEVVRLRRVRVRRQGRIAGVVLDREHQHARARIGPDVVRERVALHVLLRGVEPHLHVVARARAGHLPAHAVVPVVALVSVALAALPLGRGRRPRPAAVHAVAQLDLTEVPAGVHLHGLRVAVRDVELVDHELRRRVAEVAHRVRRVRRRAREVERELHVPLELGLDVGLVVLEREHAARGRRGALRRERDRLRGLVHVVVRVAVGRVEVGAHVRVERRDARMRVVTGERRHQRLVGGMRVHLPPERPQEQLRRGVVVLVVGEVDPVHQRQERLRLRLGGRPRAAIGLGRGVRCSSPRRRSSSASGSSGSGPRRRRR